MPDLVRSYDRVEPEFIISAFSWLGKITTLTDPNLCILIRLILMKDHYSISKSNGIPSGYRFMSLFMLYGSALIIMDGKKLWDLWRKRKFANKIVKLIKERFAYWSRAKKKFKDIWSSSIIKNWEEALPH